MTHVTAILNARIYTVDKDFRVYPHGAAVFDEHAILAVGESDEIQVPPHANVIDGKGRFAVLPGLIDVHSHSSLLKRFSSQGGEPKRKRHSGAYPGAWAVLPWYGLSERCP